MAARQRNSVRVVRTDDGPTVVLAHGFGCDQNLWRLVAPVLAEHFRVALFGYVGSGRSDLRAWQEERYAFFLGDVYGKGPQAAAVTWLVRHTLRTAALHDSDPQAVLATSTPRCSSGSPATRYCTAAFGIPDSAGETVTVRLASDGHPSALILRADGRAEYLPTPGGLLIGAFPKASFTAVRSALHPGDTLLLNTDGLTEAHGRERRPVCLRCVAVVRHRPRPRSVIDAFIGLLAGFGDGLDDDTALLALGRPRPSDTA